MSALWQPKRLGFFYDVRDQRAGQLAETLPLMSVSQVHGVVPRSELSGDDGRAETLVNYKICEPGDIVLNRMSAYNGALGVARQRGLVSPDYLVMQPRAGVDADFVVAWLKTPRGVYQMTSRLRGIGSAEAAQVRTPRINESDLRLIPVETPPAEDQRAIADYLCRETARIDTLIEEQQRLIEMLRERRRAVIDEPFLSVGESRVQLRRFIKFLTSGSRGWGDYYADEGDRFLRIGNLPRARLEIRGDIQLVNLPADVTEGSRTMLQENDLLFSITAYLGSVAVVEGDWVGAYVSQHVALCRLEPDQVDARFIGWFMLTTTGQDQLNEGAAGGTKVQLALDDIRGLRVPTVPIEQQRSIAADLDWQTSKIDVLIAETERFVELSRERRISLITAAVTGQIDVREMA